MTIPKPHITNPNKISPNPYHRKKTKSLNWQKPKPTRTKTKEKKINNNRTVNKEEEKGLTYEMR